MSRSGYLMNTVGHLVGSFTPYEILREMYQTYNGYSKQTYHDVSTQRRLKKLTNDLYKLANKNK